MKPRNNFLDHTIITFHDAKDSEKYQTDEPSTNHRRKHCQPPRFTREDYDHAAGDYEPLQKTNADSQKEVLSLKFRRPFLHDKVTQYEDLQLTDLSHIIALLKDYDIHDET